MTEIRLRSSGVAWQEVDGDLIVLDEEQATYIRLAGSAAVLWPKLVVGTTIEELAKQLVEQFEISEQQANGDVTRFVEQLSQQALLAALD